MYLRETGLLMAATLATFAITTTPSHAGETLPQVRVHYADLNLETREGGRAFGIRLRAAAVRVCGEQPPSSLGQTSEEVRCERTAIRDVKRVLEERGVAIDPTAWTVATR